MLLIIEVQKYNKHVVHLENKSNWFQWKASSTYCIFSNFRFRSLFSELRMQVESNSLHDRARLFARIPPCIDLSAVTNCVSETEKRWKSNNQNGSNFNKPLHVKTSNIENATVVKMGPDGLPIGELLVTGFFHHTYWLLVVFRSTGLDTTGSEDLDPQLGQSGGSWCAPHRRQVQDERKSFVLDVSGNVSQPLPQRRKNALSRLSSATNSRLEPLNLPSTRKKNISSGYLNFTWIIFLIRDC